MALLKNIWIEENNGEKTAIRIDWDNDRHQRLKMKDSTSKHVICALKAVVLELEKELYLEKI